MSVDEIVETAVKINPIIVVENVYVMPKKMNYIPVQRSLFSAQYLEKPIVSDKYHSFRSPTMCTIKGIPSIDDF
jgi:hypothetical protein